MSFQDPTIRILDHVPVTLSDGCILSARIWQPDSDQTLPAILEIHPYPKRYSTAERDEINHGWFARHGYVALRVDTRGGGDSEGIIEDEYQPQELADIQEVIEWIVAQDWCNGRVGMFGHSWGAYSSLLSTAKDVSALKAIVISGASDDLYAEDCHFRGGVMTSEHMGWASTMMSFFSRPPDPRIIGPGWRKLWLDRLENIRWVLPNWLNHPVRDEHWKQASLCENYDAVSVPILAASGWHDIYCNSVIRMAQNIPGVFNGVIGPWAHKFPHMGMPRPAIDWLQECVNWWDYWLKDKENGVNNLPRLRAYMAENAEPDPHSKNQRSGQWVALKEWPAHDARVKEFNLGDGTLGDNPEQLTLTVCSPQNLGTASGELMPMGWGADLPGDQRQDDALSLSFDSEILQQPVDILGHPEIELMMSVDQPVAFVVARLCDVAPDGASSRICYGVLNLTHNETHETVSQLDTGVFHKRKLVLDAAGYRFLEGHRIRLSLSTAYWPLFWPSPAAVTLQLLTGESKLRLPVKEQKDRDLVQFSAPGKTHSEPRTVLKSAYSSRTVKHDLASGDVIYKVVDKGAKEKIDQHGLTTWNTTKRVYTINKDDPAACKMTSRRNLYLQRDGLQLRTETTACMHCNSSDFFVTARLRAWEGKKRVFQRRWKNNVPRNGN